jgi:acyl-CoA synthetase (NDP forming)
MRAASSHTGAMAGSRNVWLGVVRQGGAVPVAGFEAWVDALMTFSMLPTDLGPRVAIVSGPGGLAVSAAEACGGEGLALAELSPETFSHLSRFVPPTGTSLRNPVDVGLSASFEIDIYAEAVRTVAMDPGVDAVAVIGKGMTDDLNLRYLEALVRARRETGKPILVVNIPGFEAFRPERFFKAGLPFYETAERAMRNYAMALRYRQWQKEHAGR